MTKTPMQIFHEAVERNAVLADELAADLEARDSEMPPWTALRNFATSLRYGAHAARMELQ